LIEWVKSDGAAADLAEPRWADEALRRAEAEHVFDVLAAWAARYRVDDLVEQAQLRRLPFAPVWRLGDVVRHPQLWARGFFTRDATGAPSIVGPLARAFDGGDLLTGSPGLRAGWRAERAGAAGSAPRAPFGDPSGHRPARRPGLRALTGVRVLDLTWVVAGPVATRVLADHGADVIKVERADAADGFERGGGLFANLNRGKRSLAVDLGQARGVELVRELARACDVVIDNFSPRVMANWGLDAATLRARDPRLVVVNLSGFGASGPLAGAVSYGPTLQAQTGFTWHMRHPGGAPAGWGFSYSDMVSGYCAALATVAALYRRANSGLGCAVDLAQLEVLAACIGPLLDEALRGAAVPDALGNRTPAGGAAPDGVYRCRDGEDGRERWCAIVVTGDGDWRRFAAAAGAPPWTSAARFATAADRIASAAALDRQVESWTRERAAEEVMQTLQAAGVAAGMLADARDLAGDPQLAARGYWVSLPAGSTLDGIVARLWSTPGAVTAAAPRLGAHGDEVLRDLIAMEQSAIDRLRADGVIR
jgi:crotonobetainyl-CoA:carnitine CoA-transferase CaiB-like acyl-CoA transferase